MTLRRFVTIGDSFAEGVGDPDPSRPNGVRGWADRVAEALTALDPEVRYANLAIRGSRLAEIAAGQVAPAIALAPDLVSVFAGANDLLRPTVDIDGLVHDYALVLDRLAATRARVLVWTAPDLGESKVLGALRGRFAIYNELVRELVEERGLDLVDHWRIKEFRDPRMWDADKMHPSPAGHRRMAAAALDVLAVEHGLHRPVPDSEIPTRYAAAVTAGRLWVRDVAMPRAQRLVGSTAPGRTPKRPTLEPIAPAHRPVR
jgi:lysophospholipase L1-like esterase